ncbi:MAG: PilZ domain-containing protein [Acidobacteriota bacterium]
MKKIGKEKSPPSPQRSNHENNLASELDRRREWRLALPLAAEVEGVLPNGQKFKEKTTLDNISSTGAYFDLDSGVTVGSRLKLTVDLPSNLTEGKKIHLQLEGKAVRLEKPEKSDKKQGVALQFDKEFKFINYEAKSQN